MKITKQIIATKLKPFSINQGECVAKAYEIASILFDQDIGEFPGERYKSLDDVLREISNALANEKIVIIWLDTGWINPTCRGLHCYFVFENNPLQSFAIWESPGPKFYNDTYTRKKIRETIKWFRGDGIGLHVVPP